MSRFAVSYEEGSVRRISEAVSREHALRIAEEMLALGAAENIAVLEDGAVVMTPDDVRTATGHG